MGILAYGSVSVINVNDGAKGEQGNQGASVQSEKKQWYLSTSNSALSGGSWSNTQPTVIPPADKPNNKYLWERTVTTLTDNTVINGNAFYNATIAGLISKADLIEGKITDKVWTSDITAEITAYDGSTTQAIRDRVSQTETDIEGINTQISDISSAVETKASGESVTNLTSQVNTINNTVTGHTQTISSLNTQISTKADSSTVEQLTNRVATAEQTAEGFRQTVEATYATKSALDNIKIGTRNYIDNSEYFDITQDPYKSSTCYEDKNASYQIDGINSQRVNDNQYKIIVDFPLLQENKEYVFSYDYGRSAGSLPLRTTIGGQNYDIFTIQDSNWHRNVIKFTASEQTTNASIFINKNSGGPFVLAVRRFQLEEGNLESDWHPSDADMKNYTDSQVETARSEIRQDINGITTEVSKKVDGENIISTINQSAEEVQIDASKINLIGSVTFSMLDNTTQDAITSMGSELIQSTHSASTNAWTGTTNILKSIEGGTRIAFKLNQAPTTGAATLNLTLKGNNTTGAKTIYYSGSTKLSNQYSQNSIIQLIYDGSAWRVVNPYTDENTDHYDRIRYQQPIKAWGTKIPAGNIIVAQANNTGLYMPLNTGNAFDTSYPILYAESEIGANATNGTNNYLVYPLSITNTQNASFTAYKALYIKGTLTGTTFTPVNPPLTQVIPTTVDNYQYMLLGTMYSSTELYLLAEHPIYQYYNGSFKTTSQIASEAAMSAKTANDTATEALNKTTDYIAVNQVIIGTQTAVTAAWTGDSQLETLVDGQQITYWLPFAYNASGASSYTPTGGTAASGVNLTLTLKDGTLTEAIPCFYSGVTRLTSHYAAGNSIRFTYRENAVIGAVTVTKGWWADANYNVNDNTVDNLIKYFSGKTGAIGVWNYSLFMRDAYGTYQNICTDSNGEANTEAYANSNNGFGKRTEATTKKANPNGFEVGSPVWMSTTAYNANSNMSTASSIYSSYASLFDARFSFNVERKANSLTTYKPIYLVGTINETDGLYYLDDVWWTQTATDESKIYVLAGSCYDCTTSNVRIVLYETNPWVVYRNGKLIEYNTNLAINAQASADQAQADADTANQTLANINVYNISVKYGTSTSASTKPTSWGTTVPTWSEGSYIWQQTITSYKDGTSNTDEVCLTGHKGATGASGGDAYTVVLTNESHTFPGGLSSALESSTECGIIGYKGATQVATTIGTISGIPSKGMTVTPSGSDTTSAKITISVTTELTKTSGVLTIPVTIDNKTFNKQFSYAVALKGATGENANNMATVFLYQRSETQPSVPTGSATYNFSTGKITNISVLGNWKQVIPTTDGNPCWVTSAFANNKNSTDSISVGDWSSPTKFVEDGVRGDDPVVYRLLVSENVISESNSGTRTPSKITFSAESQTGNNAPVAYTGRLVIKSTTDSTLTEWTTSHLNSDKASYTLSSIPAGTVAIKGSLYLKGGTTTLLDQQTIPIILDGIDGKDAYTVVLTNESHTFAANTSSAIQSSVDCGIIGYKGVTQMATTIGTISGTPSTGMTVTKSGSGTTSAKITVAVTSALTTRSGVLTIPVTIDGKTFNKQFSYSLALTGSHGYNTATLYLYKRASSTPTAPSSDVTYTFSTKGIVCDDFNGWDTTVPSGTDPCYVISATATSQGETDTIESSEWSNPVIMTQNGAKGDSGYNQATLYLYKRATSASKPGNLTYKFSTGELQSASGWSRTIPTTDANHNPCWVTSVSVMAVQDEITIAGTKWATPTKLVEDGDDSTSYNLIVSPNAVTLSEDGTTYSPTTIVLTAKSQTGTNAMQDYSGRFVVETTQNGTEWVTPSGWTSTANESTKSIDISTLQGVARFRCSLYLAGDTSTLLDQQTIPVISNGVGVLSIVPYYALKSSKPETTPKTSTTEWSTTPQEYTSGSKYWTSSLITYTNGNTVATDVVEHKGLNTAISTASQAQQTAGTASENASQALTQANLAQEKATVSLGMKVNYSSFTAYNLGECYLHGYDANNVASDVNGYVYWNGIKRTVPKGMINTNDFVPFFRTIYIVMRLTSATNTTGTIYQVFWDSSWKSIPASPSNGTVASAWTWEETTDIVLGQLVATDAEGTIIDAYLYNPPRNASHVLSTSDSYQYSKTAIDWVNSNGQKTLTASQIVDVWKETSTREGVTTLIQGGYIQTQTITAQQLATNAIMSQNYVGGGDNSPYSAMGTFLNLANGNIYMPNFGVNGATGAAYFNGEIVADSGSIGRDPNNKWTIGTFSEKGGNNSAGIIANGSSFIQSGKLMISTDRIDTRWYTDQREITYINHDSKYYDFGMKVPDLSSDIERDKYFLYIRKSPQNSIPLYESDWEYPFYVTSDGKVYATDIIITGGGSGSTYLPLTGGTITGNLTVSGTLTAVASSVKGKLTINGQEYNGSGNVTIDTMSVSHGGTGATSFTSGHVLIGAGEGAITTRGIRNNTSVGALWSDTTTSDTTLLTANTLANWNGLVKSSTSNLEYVKLGKLGTVVTHDLDEFITSSGGIIDGSLSVTSLTAGDLLVNGGARFVNGIIGNLTGNVTGDVTGNLTGIATYATQIKDSGDNRNITVGLSKTALTSATSFAAWSGNELRTINSANLLTSIGAMPASKTFSRNDLVVLTTKTYTGIIGSSADNNAPNNSFYFLKLRPTDFYFQWMIRYRIICTVPGKVNFRTTSDVSLFGTGQANAPIYRIFNQVESSSYRPMYYNNFQRLKLEGYNAGLSNAIGIGLRSSNNRDTAGYERTVYIEILENENCTYEFLDTPVLWENWPDGTTTNYAGLSEFDGITNGITVSGDRNANYYDRTMHTNTHYTAGANGIKNRSLIMEDSTGKWQSFTTTSGTGTGKTRNTTGFKLGQIYYYSATSDLAANTAHGNSCIYSYFPLIDIRYSINSGQTLTANKPLWIVGTMNDGLFYLDQVWYTQTAPTTADGKIYIPLGVVYNATATSTAAYQIDFIGWRGAYYHDGTKFVQYIDHAMSAKQDEDGNDISTTYLKKSGGIIDGDLTIRKSTTIAQDLPATITFSSVQTDNSLISNAFIRVYDDKDTSASGTNMVIESSGNMFIGGGESPLSLYNLYKTSAQENMFITSDNNMYLEVKADTITNRIGIKIDVGHNILPVVAETATDNIGSIGTSSYKWKDVYATNLHGKLDAKTITIGKTGKSVDWSADVAWSLDDIADVASTSSAGWMSADDKAKLNSITVTDIGTIGANSIVGNKGIDVVINNRIATITHANGPIEDASGNPITSQTVKSSNTGTVAFGASITIPSITYDAYGHITSTTTTSFKLPAAPTAITGNAATATKFASAQSVELTGDTTGSASSQAGWSLATTTSQITPTLLNNVSLNDYKATQKLQFYYGGGSNGVTDNPLGDGKQFGMITYATALAHVVQELSGKVDNNTYGKWIRFWNSSSWSNWEKFVTSVNYTAYTVKKDGTGATGTWGIDISGNANTATSATKDGAGNTIASTYVKKAGDTMTGNLSLSASNPTFTIENTNGGNDLFYFLRTGTSKADWRIKVNGIFAIQCDYITSIGDYYDVFTLEYNNGNATFKGNVTAPAFLGNATSATTASALAGTANTAGRFIIGNGTSNSYATGNMSYYNNEDVTVQSTTAKRNGIHIWGTNYGSSASNLVSNTVGVLSYGDGGPQISFSSSSDPNSTSDHGALIFTNSNYCGDGVSFHFVSNQSDWNVNSKRFVAKTSVTIGQNVPNTDYNLYVKGTSYMTGRTIGPSFSASSYIAANVDGKGDEGGLALYSTNASTYGIAMRRDTDSGKHGFVQSDWATYFYMNGNATNYKTRGWIFRSVENQTNVGSLSCEGNGVVNGSFTVGGNETNTSGVRMEYNETTKSLDFIFN